MKTILPVGTKVKFFVPHENKWLFGEIRSYTPNMREAEIVVNNYPRRVNVNNTRIEEIKNRK